QHMQEGDDRHRDLDRKKDADQHDQHVGGRIAHFVAFPLASCGIFQQLFPFGLGFLENCKTISLSVIASPCTIYSRCGLIPWIARLDISWKMLTVIRLPAAV